MSSVYPQLVHDINDPKVSLFFPPSFPLKRIISEKMQPTEKQILTANPMVGIPDLIYCPDTLPSPWQEHPRPCSGPQRISSALLTGPTIHYPLHSTAVSCLHFMQHETL